MMQPPNYVDNGIGGMNTLAKQEKYILEIEQWLEVTLSGDITVDNRKYT
jgi:hypothetical protein